MLNYAYGSRAPSRTYITLGTTPRVIKASGTVYVHSVEVKSTLARTVTFEDKDGNPYMTVKVAAPDTKVIPILWVADNGLRVSINIASATTEVTIFHSSLIGS